jgi:hypothetical protein
MKGVERFTLNNVLDIYGNRPLYRTGISVGDYPVDHHHESNPEAPKIHFPPVPSFNIPLGALIPEITEGLIVADKAISVSNPINGSTRLQPVVLLTGQAAGALAAVSIKNNINIRDVNIREVQNTLLDAGAYLMPLYDVGPDDRDFKPIQRVSSSGILRVKGEPYQWANRTWFHADSSISVREFSEGLNAFESTFMIVEDMSVLSMNKAAEMLSIITGRNISDEARNILEARSEKKFNPENPVTKRELAIITDELVRPFDTKEIRFDGRYK